LGQGISYWNHDMLCDSSQHDHWRWERVELAMFLWQCWHPSEAPAEPWSDWRFSCSSTQHWKCGDSSLAHPRSDWTPLAVAWPMSFNIHFLLLYVWNSYLDCLIVGTFVICLFLSLEHLLAVPKNIVVIIMMIIVWFITFIQCGCCIGSNIQFV
jgi:hypothetical protein